MADQDKAADGDDDDKKSPTGVISTICRRLFGGGNKEQNEYTNKEKNDTSNDGPPDVHLRCARRWYSAMPRQKMTGGVSNIQLLSLGSLWLIRPLAHQSQSDARRISIMDRGNVIRSQHQKVERASQKKPRILLLEQDLFKIRILHSLV